MSAPAAATGPERIVWPAMRLGFLGRCPACGKGRLFGHYLKVNDRCDRCLEAFHHHRADDAPAYFTILLVGHIVLPLALYVDSFWAPPLWQMLSLWVALIIVLSLALLPRIKGALVGFQWARRMHGFSESRPDRTASTIQ